MSRSRLFGQPLHVLLSKSMRHLSQGPQYARFRTATGQVVGGTPVLALSEEVLEPGYPHLQVWQVFGNPGSADAADHDAPDVLVRHFCWDQRQLRDGIDQAGSRYPVLSDVTYTLAAHTELLHWLALCAELPIRLPSLATTQPTTAVPTMRGLRISLALPWHDSAHHWQRDDTAAATQNRTWEEMQHAIATHLLATPPITALGDLQETWEQDALELGGVYANRPPSRG